MAQVFNLLKDIEELDLEGNRLTELPMTLANCQQLRIIRLSSNKFKIVPEPLEKCIQLTEIYLNQNEIYRLTNLMYERISILDLENNNLKSIPRLISSAKNLTVFNLKNNPVANLPVGLFTLPNLQHLSLDLLRFCAPPYARKIDGLELSKLLEVFRSRIQDSNLVNQALGAAGEDAAGDDTAGEDAAGEDAAGDDTAGEDKILPCFAVVYLLSRHAVRLAAVDKNKRTRLHIAAGEGNSGLVQALLKAGSPIDSLDSDLLSPLIYSVKSGSKECARLLIKNGSLVNSGGGVFGSALHVASVNTDIEIASLLLENGADPNFQDGDGNTPLHVLFSVFNSGGDRSIDFAVLLLMHGADCNYCNHEGWAPIHLASRRDQLQALNFVSECLNLSQRYAFEDWTQQILVSSLSAHNCLAKPAQFDLNIRGGSQLWTPLHLAAHGGLTRIVTILVYLGANVMIRNANYKTPREVCGSQIETAKLLIRAEKEWLFWKINRRHLQTTSETTPLSSSTQPLLSSATQPLLSCATQPLLSSATQPLLSCDEKRKLALDLAQFINPAGYDCKLFITEETKFMKSAVSHFLNNPVGIRSLYTSTNGSNPDTNGPNPDKNQPHSQKVLLRLPELPFKLDSDDDGDIVADNITLAPITARTAKRQDMQPVGIFESPRAIRQRRTIISPKQFFLANGKGDNNTSRASSEEEPQLTHSRISQFRSLSMITPPCQYPKKFAYCLRLWWNIHLGTIRSCKYQTQEFKSYQESSNYLPTRQSPRSSSETKLDWQCDRWLGSDLARCLIHFARVDMENEFMYILTGMTLDQRKALMYSANGEQGISFGCDFAACLDIKRLDHYLFLLISYSGVTEDLWDNARRCSIIHLVTAKRLLSSLQCLLLNGANPNCREEIYGRACLHFVDCAKIMLALLYHPSIDTDCQDREGLTCLDIQIKKGRLHLVAMLINRGASIPQNPFKPENQAMHDLLALNGFYCKPDWPKNKRSFMGSPLNPGEEQTTSSLRPTRRCAQPQQHFCAQCRNTPNRNIFTPRHHHTLIECTNCSLPICRTCCYQMIRLINNPFPMLQDLPRPSKIILSEKCPRRLVVYTEESVLDAAISDAIHGDIKNSKKQTFLPSYGSTEQWTKIIQGLRTSFKKLTNSNRTTHGIWSSAEQSTASTARRRYDPICSACAEFFKTLPFMNVLMKLERNYQQP